MFSKFRSSLPHGFTLIFLIAQVFCAGLYGSYLWDRPHFQFFPIAGLFSVWFIWSAKKQIAKPVAFNGSIILSLLLLCVLLLGAAFLLHSYWLIGLELFSAMLAIILSGLGGRGIGRCFPSLVLLGICLLPAYSLDFEMLNALRSQTTKSASKILYYIDVNHILHGSSIDTASKKLFVDEACSGINSLFSVVVFTLIWCALRKFHWVETILLCTCAAIWAIVLDVFRIAFMAWALLERDWDLRFGLQRQILGLATFVAALFLSWNSRQIILFCKGLIPWGLFEEGGPFSEEEPEQASAAIPTRASAAPKGTPGFADFPIPKRFGNAVAMAALLLSLGFGGYYFGEWTRLAFGDLSKGSRRIENNLSLLEKESMPLKGNGWQLQDFEVQSRDAGSLFGKKSATWKGFVGAYPVTVSFDFPFVGWQDATRCYTPQGWTVAETSDTRSKEGWESSIRSVPMSRYGFEKAFLYFGAIDCDGDSVAPVDDRTEGFFGRSDSLGAKPQVRVRVWLLTDCKIEPSIEEACLDLLAKATEVVRTKIR